MVAVAMAPHADDACAPAMLKKYEKLSGTLSRRVAGRILLPESL